MSWSVLVVNGGDRMEELLYLQNAVRNIFIYDASWVCVHEKKVFRTSVIILPPTNEPAKMLCFKSCLFVHRGGPVWPFPMMHWTSLYMGPHCTGLPGPAPCWWHLLAISGGGMHPTGMLSFCEYFCGNCSCSYTYLQAQGLIGQGEMINSKPLKWTDVPEVWCWGNVETQTGEVGGGVGEQEEDGGEWWYSVQWAYE